MIAMIVLAQRFCNLTWLHQWRFHLALKSTFDWMYKRLTGRWSDLGVRI